MSNVRLILAVLLLWWASSLHAETGIFLTGANSEEKRVTVGELVPQLEPSSAVMVVTMQGYLLQLWRTNGRIYAPNSPKDSPVYSNQIYNTSSNCSGLNFISGGSLSESYSLHGRIFVLEQNTPTPGPYVVPWNSVPRELVARGDVDSSGVCHEIFYPFSVDNAVELEEIDLGSLGFEFDTTGTPTWILREPLWEVRRTEGIFCSGFESCPAQAASSQ